MVVQEKEGIVGLPSLFYFYFIFIFILFYNQQFITRSV